MDNNLVGQTIQGRYYVVKQLGRGGVGITFLAQDRQCFDSPCVVKQLKPKSANTQTQQIARRLFNREAQIMNRLGDCDRIPRLLAYFEHHNDFFLVQELIEGHDLSKEIIPGEPWSEKSTITLVKDILSVLLVVQQHSVIHRDLKPSNLIRRQEDNKIVLIDFGSVKQVSTQIVDAAGEVKQTVAVGTKSYMPMEQMSGRPGFYSDIYAVGIIAIQAITGISPKKFTIDKTGEIIWRRLLDPTANYQPRFLDLLDKMVRYRHQERYPSAAIVLADLEQLDIDRDLVSKKISSTPETQLTANQKNQLIDGQLDSNDRHLATDTNQVANSVDSKPNQFKLLAAIATTTILIIGAVGTWLLLKDSEPQIQLSLYENPDRDFKVNYPQAWSKQNRDDFFATGVIFFSPLKDNSDKFKERVSVLVENLANDMTLAEYTEKSIAEIKKLSDPNVDEAKAVNLGANEGRQVIYNSEQNGTPVQRMQTWTIENNRAYVVTYTAQPDSYDDYLPAVEKMIESFETIN